MSRAYRSGVPNSTARTAVTSLIWNYAGSLFAIVLQLGYTAYTGRTVSSASFGAYAIALTVAQLVGYFANAGLATCLLRADRLDAATVMAAYRLAAASSVICFVVVEASAPLCERLWHVPGTTPLLQVLGFQVLVQPAASVATSTLRRLGCARVAVAAEVTGQVVGTAAGVMLLILGWNPIGLAAVSPVAAASVLMTGALSLRHRLATGRSRVRARDLVARSSFQAGYNLSQFATNSLPMWTVGRLLGPSSAGWFSRAGLLTGLPLTFLAQGLSLACLPALAERRAQGRHLGRSVEYTVCVGSAAAFSVFGLLAGIGPTALRLLLGPGWDAAASLVPLLSVGSAVTLLCCLGSAIDQARGAAGALWRAQLVAAVGTVAGIAAAVAGHSVGLLACAASVGQTAGHLLQLARWHQSGLLDARRLARTYLWHAMAGTALGTASAIAALGRPPAMGLLCGLAAALPVLLCCVLLRTRIPLYAAMESMGLVRRRGAAAPVMDLP